MERKVNENHIRPDLKCLSVGKVYPLLRYLAEKAGLSVSAWIRNITIKEYKKEKSKELVLTEQ